MKTGKTKPKTKKNFFYKKNLQKNSTSNKKNKGFYKAKISLKEKESLLQEVHHRVKNNLQIIISLMNLQKIYVTDNPLAENVLKESQSRVKSMATIHEKLYQSHDLNHINIKEYTERLVYDLFYSYGIQDDKIKLVIEVEPIFLNTETSYPAALSLMN